ncbi:UNVERIFIED_CONTAM: putative disease resistance protein [Sesamum latifolium]|uniref:Disease resistance protein n=1 Tax=Sesamum latifolium TaxID=2727402 RepID=A0AAW2XS86_9LAMI
MAVETLRELLIEEAKFLSGVCDQVEEVERQLTIIHCFLKDADKRKDRYNSETIRKWVAELRDLSIKAENVLERYAVEVESMNQGEISSRSIEYDTDWSRKTYGLDVEKHFVGMKEEVKLLESLLESDNMSHRVISICGMGGLGKTTVATKIYNGEVAQRCFDAVLGSV